MNEIPRPPRENAAEGEDRLKETAAMDEQPAQFDAETEAVEAAAEEIAERTPEEEAKHWHEQYLRTLADAPASAWLMARRRPPATGKSRRALKTSLAG